MRGDDYIKNIYKVFEDELLLVDTKEQQLENDLNILTATTQITTYENDYRVENKVQYGTYFRRNVVVAKKIARYLNWNLETIGIYTNLFLLGSVKEVLNDKKNYIQTIIVYDSIANDKYLEEFKKFINEIGPAYYEFEIRGEQ